jgi:hypothetical protein
MRKNGGVNGSEPARIRRATAKGTPKCSREKERMQDEEGRSDAFVNGSISHAKLIAVTGRALGFGVTLYTWRLLYGCLWSCHPLCHD